MPNPPPLSHYQKLWDSMVILDNRKPEASLAAKLITRNKSKYVELCNLFTNGLDWRIVGLAHYMESNCNFNTHLFNGDSLKKKTVRYPAGYPKVGQPPFTWLFSATQAITDKGKGSRWDLLKSFTIPDILMALEKYNGLGYTDEYKDSKGRTKNQRIEIVFKDMNPSEFFEMKKRVGDYPYQQEHMFINTPYLWSGTNHYFSGKLTEGKIIDEKTGQFKIDPKTGEFIYGVFFDPKLISKQIGAAAILRYLDK